MSSSRKILNEQLKKLLLRHDTGFADKRTGEHQPIQNFSSPGIA
jgi:hypothetical protein